MRTRREIRVRDDFEDWRAKARALLLEEREPSAVDFIEEGDAQETLLLFGAQPESEPGPEARAAIPPPPRASSSPGGMTVPREFLAQAKFAAAHRHESRWAMLYRVLWRLTHGEPELLSISIDPDVASLLSMVRSVRRDMHKMTAFVRFREVKARDPLGGEDSWFVAWHEPDHRIVRLTAPFFLKRFNGMSFSILTPDESLHWDGQRAVFGPGSSRSQAPRADEMEDLWRTYYASIFNPARIKERAMKKELPVRYWKNLPESRLIPELIRQAPARLQEFHRNQRPHVEGFLPPAKGRTLVTLRAAIATCRGCGICEHATQAVFGEGPEQAPLVIVGEQPGDQEDLSGRPFVGPAGELLDQALCEAGIERAGIYLTNAVKHFKWTPGQPGQKTRIHQRPSSAEIAACKPWLNAELALLRPRVLLCLGASAAQSVLGKAVTLREVRGQWLASAACARTRISIHPSAILRTQDPAARGQELGALIEDLRQTNAEISRLQFA